MKRNLMILALASAIVAMMVAFAAPAMANNNHNDDNNNVTNHHNGCFGCGFDHRFNDNRFNDEFCCDGFFLVANPFDNEVFEDFEDCPFAGDTEGIVNEFDCFD